MPVLAPRDFGRSPHPIQLPLRHDRRAITVARPLHEVTIISPPPTIAHGLPFRLTPTLPLVYCTVVIQQPAYPYVRPSRIP